MMTMAAPGRTLRMASLPVTSSRARAQCDFLHPPVRQLANEQLVLATAVDGVGDAELFRQLAGAAELADDAAVELELVDFTVVERFGVVRVRAVKILMLPARDANRRRRADVCHLHLWITVAVEHLDALVA